MEGRPQRSQALHLSRPDSHIRTVVARGSLWETHGEREGQKRQHALGSMPWGYHAPCPIQSRYLILKCGSTPKVAEHLYARRAAKTSPKTSI